MTLIASPKSVRNLPGGFVLKRTAVTLPLILLSLSSLLAQTSTPANGYPASGRVSAAQEVKAAKVAKKKAQAPKPFSRIALSGGVSTMGVNMQVATNVNRFLNLRGTGSLLNYSVNNISTNGFNVDAKLNFASSGASVDLYPFPNHGFRLSPGVLFQNNNNASAVVTASPGTSFTLNDQTYYTSLAIPVTGTGSLGLNTQKTAFTMTTGWGNMIPRSGGHWAFPVELGVAMVGSPTVNMALTSGQVCANAAGTSGCVNVVGDSTLNANLQAQINKYTNDLNQLKMYPIVSFGVSYNFKIR